MNKIVLFSPSMCGAYRPEVHGADIPADVVEVSESVWQALLDELEVSPKKMSSRPDGQPVLIDPPPLDDEELAAVERAWRDAQLALTDPLVSRHRDEIEEGGSTSITAEQYAELQAYRRQMRDWPQGSQFPLAEHRPIAPLWLTEPPQ
ncbi:phage tail assembly chaperone [Pseudomonas sp. VE 196-7]|uniref:phage tail assembly chaperone n=1 Tax=Pseudomonas sp. VE 196-7 TaxID=2956726 RepID=UPI0021D5090E|nr:phage tail assembly chaperone [Pseudomonas sp. VE 196-7]MCU7217532.1 phage tail assembly chaperone [Pseudomonas sp. VE 196-7]